MDKQLRDPVIRSDDPTASWPNGEYWVMLRTLFNELRAQAELYASMGFPERARRLQARATTILAIHQNFGGQTATSSR